MTNKEQDIKVLIELLNNKLTLLTDFLKLTHGQTAVIKEEKMDKLDELIKEKQFLIEKIDGIDEDFTREFSLLKKKYNLAEIGDLAVKRDYLIELKGLTKEVTDVMAQISEIDEKNRELINKNFSGLKSKIKGLQKGKKATAHYYKQPFQLGGCFIDKRN